MDELDKAVKYLQLSVNGLLEASEVCYTANDNKRGIIRHDAAKDLASLLALLKIKQAYIKGVLLR